MNKHNIVVGMSLWVTGGFRPSETVERKVGRVGKKYFYLLDDVRTTPFSLETLRSATDTNYPLQCHLTLQEILDEREVEQLTRDLRKRFDIYNTTLIPIYQLRRISAIVNNTEDRENNTQTDVLNYLNQNQVEPIDMEDPYNHFIGIMDLMDLEFTGVEQGWRVKPQSNG